MTGYVDIWQLKGLLWPPHD